MKRSVSLAFLAAATAALAFVAMPARAATITSSEEAGWQAGTAAPCDPAVPGCWHFRYVQAQFALPDVTGSADKAAFPNGVGFSVRLTNLDSSAVLGISTTPASGAWNAAFAFESDHHTIIGGCSNGASPATSAGDVELISLYFDYAHNVFSYVVTDKTNPAKDFSGACTDPVPGDSFTQAQIGNEFGVWYTDNAAPNLVNGNMHLSLFTDTVITNKSGARGSAGSPPGPSNRLQLNQNGGTSGPVVASTPFTWGTYAIAPDSVSRPGRNFSVWLPSYPG